MATSRKKTGAAAPARAPAKPDTPLSPTAKAARTAVKSVQKAKAAGTDKDKDKEKDKKLKLVRDSFTIPKAEYAVLEALKLRAAKAGAPAKKSEVLRAGIKTLAALSDDAFLAALGAVPSLKTGRPARQ